MRNVNVHGASDVMHILEWQDILSDALAPLSPKLTVRNANDSLLRMNVHFQRIAIRHFAVFSPTALRQSVIRGYSTATTQSPEGAFRDLG